MIESNSVAENLENSIVKNIEPLAKTVAEAHQIPGAQLENVSLHQKRIENDLSQYMAYAKRRCREGFRFCYDALKGISEDEICGVEQNISEAFSRFDTPAHAMQMSTKVLQGSVWKDLLGLEDATLTKLYKGAKQLIDSGRFPEAEAAFFFLTTIDSSQYIFWLGLGHAAFRLGNLNQAINAYETAVTVQPGSIWPHIYIANCFEAMNDFHESLIALEQAHLDYQTNPCDDQELDQILQERIRFLKSK